ncbi:MAG: PilZ domain-containing protein [Nitrospinae bacterium]|nr:PilZ domain-containing protein [Nitrospinota bacterium]MBF0634574.1 PilZ domain-containing protein [Nitrospinota bacterium]
MRRFSRVDALLPFTARLATDVPEDEMLSRPLNNTMAPYFPEPPALDNEPLEAWLSILNSKLDTIMRILTLKDAGFLSLPIGHVTISGSGLSYNSPERRNPGDIVEMKLLMPSVSGHAILIYGRVTGAEEKETGFRVATEFVAMDENLRDQIIDFVFRREREILREKRGEGF